MVGKIKEGKGFAGCVAYNIDREKAIILGAEGLGILNTKSIVRDFHLQRQMNPNLEKAVGVEAY